MSSAGSKLNVDSADKAAIVNDQMSPAGSNMNPRFHNYLYMYKKLRTLDLFISSLSQHPISSNIGPYEFIICMTTDKINVIAIILVCQIAYL